MKDFLKRLIASRKKLGTQKEVAENISIHHSTISRYEKGDSKSYELNFLQYLAQQGIDLNWLFTGKEPSKADKYIIDELIKSYQEKFEGLEMKIESLKELVHVREQEIYFLNEKIKKLENKPTT